MTISIEGAARRIGISENSVIKLIDEGELKEASKGKIYLDSIYEYTGLSTKAKQTGRTQAKRSQVKPKSTPKVHDPVFEGMSTHEAMEKIGIAEATMYYHIKKGSLKKNKDGSMNDASVYAFIEKRRKDTTEDSEQGASALPECETRTVHEDSDIDAKVQEDIFKEVEEEFYQEHILGHLYTEAEVTKALKEAYKRGMESVFRKIGGEA